jgi:hypothetical protein
VINQDNLHHTTVTYKIVLIVELLMPICPDLIINCSFGAIPKSDNLNTLDQPSSLQGSMSVLMSVVPTLFVSVIWAFTYIEKTEQVEIKLPF